MSAPENLNSLVGRLATFEAPKQLTKRRASTTRKKTATTVAWPHADPSPEELAKAGFYYAPSANHPDNVVCFMCDRKLDGWEAEDVPALEHLSHAPECPWAINVCLSLRNPEENEDPMGEKMVMARTATFAGSWPHEKKKGWKCKTKKMVEAGWCFDPSPEYEDGVACFYCMLSLDGWEPKDDPMDEHHKRSPDCPFFMLVDVYADTRKPTKGKKGRASTASKASRLSIQSTRDFDTFSEAPSLMSLGDDGPHEDDSALTVASNATTTSMARGKKGTGKATTAAKGTRKTTRGRKADDDVTPTELEAEPTFEPLDTDLSLGDLNATDGDSVMTTATATKTGEGRKTATKAKTAKAPRKTSRTTKKNGAADSTLLDEPTAEATETEADVEPVKPIGRATRRTSRLEAPSYVDQTSQLETQVDVEPPKKATRAKRGRKAKVAEESQLSNDASQLHSELEDAVTKAADEEPVKPKRGRKRTSGGDVKTDDSVMIVEEPPKPAKAKRGRKAKQVEEEPVPEPEDAETTENMPPPKPAAKPKRGRKAKQQVVEDSTMDATTENLPRQPSPPPREPTPVHDVAPSPEAVSEAAKEPTPSPSPQSSDAENKPPSSQPASARPSLAAHAPLSGRNVRVALAEASTPRKSPSKRGGEAVGGVSSTLPWEAVDLENIFLQSPGTRRLGDNNGDKANGSNLEELSLDEAVRKVRREITSAEKKMTVEQWVQFQAEKGERQLRDECERMVGIFETQGTKAMRTLEGIRCSN